MPLMQRLKACKATHQPVIPAAISPSAAAPAINALIVAIAWGVVNAWAHEFVARRPVSAKMSFYTGNKHYKGIYLDNFMCLFSL
jgi:hypothetical protein